MSHIEKIVRQLGAAPWAFPPADQTRVQTIKSKQANPATVARIRAELGRNPTPTRRYELEYQHGLYHTYKPGIDDAYLNGVLGGVRIEDALTVEIGGGPAYLAKRSSQGICLDIALHPNLGAVQGIQGDICNGADFARLKTALRAAMVCKGAVGFDQIFAKTKPLLVVMSYCLDRVGDQQAALRHFADLIMQQEVAVGLLTVCLPATPVSPGVAGINYASPGKWVTRGQSAAEDFIAIVNACGARGLRFMKGGMTTHFGVSLDGYEELPCYVATFGAALGWDSSR